MSHDSRELETVLDTIHAAGEEILRRYQSFERIEDAPADISTEADKASQEMILERLHRAFPGDGLCAEESSARFETEATGEGRFWVVDPIDGTRGFARKNGEFSVMIALAVEGRVVVGAVYEPAIDRVTYASVGGGCHVRQPFGAEPRRCAVTGTEGTPRALAMSRSRGAEGERELLEAFGAERSVQTYSAGIKMAQVARGEVDLYLGDYLTLHDWDVAAGHILVTEAGGRVTNIEGEEILYDGSGKSLQGKGIVVTNGGVHEAALATLATGTVKF